LRFCLGGFQVEIFERFFEGGSFIIFELALENRLTEIIASFLRINKKLLFFELLGNLIMIQSLVPF
jgi:hypothetical protein